MEFWISGLWDIGKTYYFCLQFIENKQAKGAISDLGLFRFAPREAQSMIMGESFLMR